MLDKAKVRFILCGSSLLLLLDLSLALCLSELQGIASLRLFMYGCCFISWAPSRRLVGMPAAENPDMRLDS